MHIEVEQSTQLVAANRTRKWYPEEIDWVLNKMMHRFIEGSLIKRNDGSGGFELDQSKVDNIKPLLRTKQELTAWIDSTERYKCFLPADYLHLLSDASYTRPNCGAVDPLTTAHLHFVTRLLQTKSTKVSANYYLTLVLTINAATTTIPTDLPYNNKYLGYPEKDDISFLVPWILYKAGLRWERFDNNYYPGNYISVVEAASAPAAPTVVVDDIVFNTQAVSSFSVNKHTESTHKKHNNRLIASNLVATMMPTAFFKSSYLSPISELERDILWIYRDNSFTVSRTEISYIRKPQPISLSLGTDCELGEGAHQKICDLAVEYLQGRTKDLNGVKLSEADIAKRIIL